MFIYCPNTILSIWGLPEVSANFEYDCPSIEALSDLLKMNVDKCVIEDATLTIETTKEFFDSVRTMLKNLKSLRVLTMRHLSKNLLKNALAQVFFSFFYSYSSNSNFRTTIVDLVKVLPIQELEYTLGCGYLKDPRNQLVLFFA